MLPANAYTIRPATLADGAALERVARLDSQRPLTGRVLVAEADGTIVAALSVDEGRSVADPFTPTAAARALLRARLSGLIAHQHEPELRERLRDGVRVRRRLAGALA